MFGGGEADGGEVESGEVTGEVERDPAEAVVLEVMKLLRALWEPLEPSRARESCGVKDMLRNLLTTLRVPEVRGPEGGDEGVRLNLRSVEDHEEPLGGEVLSCQPAKEEIEKG